MNMSIAKCHRVKVRTNICIYEAKKFTCNMNNVVQDTRYKQFHFLMILTVNLLFKLRDCYSIASGLQTTVD